MTEREREQLWREYYDEKDRDRHRERNWGTEHEGKDYDPYRRADKPSSDPKYCLRGLTFKQAVEKIGTWLTNG